MTPTRLLLACLLVAAASPAWAAPAPFSRPRREHDDPAAVARLKRELAEHQVIVQAIEPNGPGSWVVRFLDRRAMGLGCKVGFQGFQRSSRIIASSRSAALQHLLLDCRKEHERLLQRLRALGAIP
jgi:hypothetical protein